MISLEDFIKDCERELLLKRTLSKETLLLINNLSDKNKILCKPILNFFGRMRRTPIDIEIDIKEFKFSPKERILVCRLIPLSMSLDTDSPAWSSYMLTQAIQAAISINGIKLSEIGIAILEIFYEFKTPLNWFVYNFCIDLSKEFTIYYRERLKELDILSSWENPHSQSIESVEFLISSLSSKSEPEYILKTMVALIQNEFFEEYIGTTKYLFENSEYKNKFINCLSKAKLSKNNEYLILSKINSDQSI